MARKIRADITYKELESKINDALLLDKDTAIACGKCLYVRIQRGKVYYATRINQKFSFIDNFKNITLAESRDKAFSFLAKSENKDKLNLLPNVDHKLKHKFIDLVKQNGELFGTYAERYIEIKKNAVVRWKNIRP